MMPVHYKKEKPNTPAYNKAMREHKDSVKNKAGKGDKLILYYKKMIRLQKAKNIRDLKYDRIGIVGSKKKEELLKSYSKKLKRFKKRVPKAGGRTVRRSKGYA